MNAVVPNPAATSCSTVVPVLLDVMSFVLHCVLLDVPPSVLAGLWACGARCVCVRRGVMNVC